MLKLDTKDIIDVDNKRSLINKICLQIVLFLYFYNIPLYYFGIPLSSGKLVSVVGILYIILILFIKKGNEIKIPRNYIDFTIGAVIVYVVVFFITKILYSTSDSFYLTVTVFYVLEYLIGAYIIVVLFNISSLEKLLESLITVIVIQALIMFNSLLIPGLKIFVVSVMEANPAFQNFSRADQIADSFRGLSLASDRTLGMSVFMSIGLMLIYSMFLVKNRKYNYLKRVFFFIIIFIGGVLAARTFFVGLFFGLLFVFISIIRLPIQNFKLKKFIRLLIVCLFLVFLIIPFVIKFYFREYQDEINLALEWAFEMFINLFEEGTLRSDSSDDLFENHLGIIPSDLQTILIGDSNRTFNNGTHYMGQFTDSGYLRMLFVYGVIGSLTVYFFWIYIVSLTSKLYTKEEGIKTLLYFILIILFVSQIKYDVFPGSALNLKLIVMMFVFGVERERLRTRNKISKRFINIF